MKNYKLVENLLKNVIISIQDFAPKIQPWLQNKNMHRKENIYLNKLHFKRVNLLKNLAFSPFKMLIFAGRVIAVLITLGL